MDSIMTDKFIDLMAEICVLCSKLGMRRTDVPELWKMSEDELKIYRDDLKVRFEEYQKQFERQID